MPPAIRLLYVDDEPSLLDIGKLFLEESGFFSVATIDSATAALELIRQEPFDAIVSDYQMPGMDGIRFLVEVRTEFGQIPFILFRKEVIPAPSLPSSRTRSGRQLRSARMSLRSGRVRSGSGASPRGYRT
jgi:CheY-like chemotaxis protein